MDRTLGVYQQWTFVPLIDGEDLIVNVGSGLVLDDPPSFSTNNVDQWQLNDGANQQWNIVPVNGGGGEVFTIFSANSGGQLESTGYPGGSIRTPLLPGASTGFCYRSPSLKRRLTYDRLVCRDSNQVPSTAASRTRLLRTRIAPPVEHRDEHLTGRSREQQSPSSHLEDREVRHGFHPDLVRDIRVIRGEKRDISGEKREITN